MNNLSVSILTIFLMFAPATLLAEDNLLHSKLVVVSANAQLAEEDNNFRNLFNNSSKPAIRLTFMVKAKNIIQVMENSVLTNASEGWKCGSFPRVSKEADAAVFVIEKKGDFLEDVHKAKVVGTIEIQTGTKLIPKTFSLLAFDEPFRMDDFLFTLIEGKLKIEGNHKLIKEISVKYNDKILNNSGSSWSDESRTYQYKGIGKGVEITFSYWDGLVTKKVHFSKSNK
jgi:hypothetical protein|tara:strand:- start:6694 stop:7374 length:681 start_codon:yes stop_codon:yes gene_type:complete